MKLSTVDRGTGRYEPARTVGRQVFRAAGDTYLVPFEGMTSRRFVRLHIVENLT